MTTTETPYVPGLSPNTVSALLRFLSASGSFDPNEDPVLIGNAASIDDGGGDTATPGSPGTFFTGTTVVGAGGFADGAGGQTVLGAIAGCFGPGSDGTALGTASQANDEAATAVGYDSRATRHDVAIGGQAGTSNSGSAGAVGIGHQASAGGDGAVAIGDSSEAVADQAIAIGWGAFARDAGTALGTSATVAGVNAGTAIGNSASLDADTEWAVAVGAFAAIDAGGNDATAIGHASGNGGNDYCTAIGHHALNTRSGQVMLGTAGDFTETDLGYVVTDTDGSGNRWIIQVTAGVITLSAAP